MTFCIRQNAPRLTIFASVAFGHGGERASAKTTALEVPTWRGLRGPLAESSQIRDGDRFSRRGRGACAFIAARKHAAAARKGRVMHRIGCGTGICPTSGVSFMAFAPDVPPIVAPPGVYQ